VDEVAADVVDADGQDDGMRPLLAADVRFAAAAGLAAGAAALAESADSTVSVLPTVSAGSGAAVLNPASAASSSALSAGAAVEASPEEEESPLASPGHGDASDRELPVRFHDDDMMPLSTITSSASPSGSVFRLGDAMMSGD
jgi:hypothetical protein